MVCEEVAADGGGGCCAGRLRVGGWCHLGGWREGFNDLDRALWFGPGGGAVVRQSRLICRMEQ